MRSTLEPVELPLGCVDQRGRGARRAPARRSTARHRRLSREVRVPGFRRGKVPRQVIEARIGRDGPAGRGHRAGGRARVLRQGDRGARASSRCPGPRSSRPTTPTASRSSSRLPSRSSPSSTLPPTGGSRSSGRPWRSPTSTSTPSWSGCATASPSWRSSGGPWPRATSPRSTCGPPTTPRSPELTRSDFLYEVGSGTVVPQLDEELEGSARATSSRFNATPARGGRRGAGRPRGHLPVLVKEAKAKVLPGLDDDFAQEASGVRHP